MLSKREIVLPEAKPALEWVCGRAVQKVSPKRRHALLQLAIGEALRAWARGRGEVGSEWRFRLAPPGEIRRPLVPDLAYISRERSAGLRGKDLEEPPVAPDIVVEILSPGDRAAYVDEKRRVYLASGVKLLMHVDAQAKRVEAYYGDGRHEAVPLDTSYMPKEFPGLKLRFGEFFQELERKG